MLPLLTLLPFFAGSLVVAQGTTCNATNLCPSSSPCCSEYGYCGTGTFCLGGCDPLTSHSMDSCMPNPVCKSNKYTFANFSRILSNSTHYTGNATEYDWTVDQGQIINTNSSGGEMALILTQTGGGTRVSSARYVHYATITTRLKTGRWGGVVTAFITMSNIKDEIDWEFPGANTTEGQTNFFWEGVIPSKTAGNTSGGLNDTFSNYHDYTIDWQPDTLTWSIDGNVVRTVKRTDTIGSDGVAHYPTTPARIQLSIWPAGISGEPQGTIDWAGGLINWDDPDYKAAGHFYALVSSVEVKCADPTTPGPNVTSYTYNNSSSSSSPGISFSDATTVNGAAGSHVSAAFTLVGIAAMGLFLSVIM